MTEGPAFVFRARTEVRWCFYLQGYRLTSTEFTAQFEETTRWCTDQFGEAGNRWEANYGRNWVHFRDEIAATAFKMRWC